MAATIYKRDNSKSETDFLLIFNYSLKHEKLVLRLDYKITLFNDRVFINK